MLWRNRILCATASASSSLDSSSETPSLLVPSSYKCTAKAPTEDQPESHQRLRGRAAPCHSPHCLQSQLMLPTEHSETEFSWHHRDFTDFNSFPPLLPCPRGNEREFWVGGVGAEAKAGRGGGSSSSWLCLTSSLKPREIAPRYKPGGNRPKTLSCAPTLSSAPLQTPSQRGAGMAQYDRIPHRIYSKFFMWS